MALWSFGRGSASDAAFKQRFHAWWNGYDVDAARSRQRAAQESRSAPERDESGGDAPTGAAGGRTSDWDAVRRKMAEDVWSPGFIVPGGNAYVEELVNGCGLTAAETLLEIGVGMGGGTRTIIAKFGNYVTGYESDPQLAEEARRQAVAFDMDGKLEVISVPFDSLQVRRSFFRAALMRDVLFTVEDKEPLLETVCSGLKSGESHLVISDFMRAPDGEGPALKAWMEGETNEVYPWTLAELKSCLKHCAVKFRIEEDQSERYCQMVATAWSEYLATLKGKEVSEALGHRVMKEAAYWTRRVAALESGALRYYVVKAVKNT